MKTIIRELFVLTSACLTVQAFAQSEPPSYTQLLSSSLGNDAAAENAQSTTVADSNRRPTRGLEEVIVTATKRAESVQDVPISIAVINSQDIERRSLIGMEDYLRAIPGVNQIDQGPAGNAIVIRGITVSPSGENFSTGPTVASYFDETAVTGAASLQAGGIDVRPVDIERIEVLRGPQGTAFGSSSLSGTLRLIPVKPRLDGFSAKVAASYSNTSRYGSDNSMAQGVVNIPIVRDKLALRAVGYRYDESGVHRNVAGVHGPTIAQADAVGIGDFVRGHVEDDVGRLVSTGARLAALWQMTEKVSLSANFLTQTLEQDGAPLSTIGPYVQTRPPIAPQLRSRGEDGEVADTEMDLTSAQLTYDSKWGALTSVVSYIDSGFSGATALILPFVSTSWRGNDNTYNSLSAETRFASALKGRFQFLAGVFYEDVDEEFLQVSDWPGAPAPSPVFGTSPVGISERTRGVDQQAMFGEVSYALTDKLTATAGGRYFEYDKTEHILRREGGLFGVPIGGTIPRTLTNSQNDNVKKISLDYKPTQGSLLYVSWAEGFRLGRGDAGAIPTLCDPDGDGLVNGSGVTVESTQHINSDFLENYELGGKLSLFDRRLSVDTSIYHINWTGLPIRFFTPGCKTGFFANVGEATSDGIEIQASLYATEGLRIDLGAGYTDAQLSKDAPGLPGSPREGDQLPGAPKVNVNLAVQYDFDLAGYKAFVRADSFYAGEFYGAFVVTPGSQPAGDYIKVDMRAGVLIDAFSAELFVRNLTNEDAFTWRGLGTPVDSFSGFQLRPRTVGIRLGYAFE